MCVFFYVRPCAKFWVRFKLVSHARIFLRKDLREKIHKEAYVTKLRKRPYESLCSYVRKRLYDDRRFWIRPTNLDRNVSGYYISTF